MPTSNTEKTIVELEKRFWQSMVDQDADTAVSMLHEPAVMVSSHGAIQFDHAGYRKMSDQGPSVLKSFDLSDVKVVFPNAATAVMSYRVKQGVSKRGESGETTQEMNDTSTWVKDGKDWRCVMHTETPVASKH